MLFLTILKVAMKSLMANKLRSFLAMLGIIIGVGSVISMLALGAGAQAQVMNRVSAMGTNLLIVRAGQGRRGPRSSGAVKTLTLEDASAILEKVDGIDSLAPVVMGNAQCKYYNRNVNTSVVGSSFTYFPIRSFEIGKGRSFNEIEAERMARVAVIGPMTAENLFEEADPLGETFKLKGINFRVVGVLKSKGDQGWFNPDDQVLVPYSTAMRQLFGLDYVREIDVQVCEGEALDRVAEDIAKLLRRRHRVRTPEEDDFHIRNQAEILEMASSVTQTFTILLGGIAGISLLVGGIGIMNIMLVTVTERTREIGVRKAIGARDRDIMRQFLYESLLISGLGGLLGVGMGAGIASIISMATQFTTVVRYESVLLALGVSASVGVFFGFYPARRAAAMNPIDALRYE